MLVRGRISSGSTKEKAGTLANCIQNHIRLIEKFAPPEHKKERQARYYNYGMLAEYQKPLHALLCAISECKDRTQEGEMAQSLKVLFYKMKDFYDPKQRLSLDQAREDRELRRRLRRALLIFYKKEETVDSEILSYLQEQRVAGLESRRKEMSQPE
jgi:hypothetical protein